MAWLSGAIAAQVRRRATGLWRVIGYTLSALAGVSVMYLLGTARLAAVLQIGAAQAMAVGVAPFVLPDLGKAVAAALLVRGLERRGLGIE
jgi:biotin transporter BioY